MLPIITDNENNIHQLCKMQKMTLGNTLNDYNKACLYITVYCITFPFSEPSKTNYLVFISRSNMDNLTSFLFIVNIITGVPDDRVK